MELTREELALIHAVRRYRDISAKTSSPEYASLQFFALKQAEVVAQRLSAIIGTGWENEAHLSTRNSIRAALFDEGFMHDPLPGSTEEQLGAVIQRLKDRLMEISVAIDLLCGPPDDDGPADPLEEAMSLPNLTRDLGVEYAEDVRRFLLGDK